ncbi:CBF/Mak21 family-domain-containing protein [Catenaria anguillulae PL171]|uniref:CBF/Mak21 family-domain-containing protein n=1 Tax=Catenaria anguillulae PL171 TaxID=765915 RepID=A0A1Y2HTJ0_9FUNG|nr:CBF/Mak21 family-domain-containing protein [Catenaria anguillulae PL171]
MTKPMSSLPTGGHAASSSGSASASASANAKSKSKENIADVVATIRTLERSLILSQANINNIPKLLKYTASTHPHRVIHAALSSLRRLFSHFTDQGALDKVHLASEKDHVAQELCKWLRKHREAYVTRLAEIAQEEESAAEAVALQVTAAKLLLDLSLDYSRELRKTSPVNVFDNVFFLTKVVQPTLLRAEWSPVFARDFTQVFVENADARFYLYKAVAKIIAAQVDLATKVEAEAASASAGTSEGTKSKQASKRKRAQLESDADAAVTSLLRLATNAFHLLERLPCALPNSPTFLIDRAAIPDNHPVTQAKEHKRAYSEFVLQYLRLPMTTELYKKVLMLTPTRLIPNLTDPRLLMTYLSESYDQGGSVALLALQSVFVLIAKHNLDYPDFYKKLYTLFDRNLYHVKYRSRFFRLFTTFMSSTHLPAYLVAAFIKRMARLALTAPPAGILIMIPMVYNLIKQHPQCFVLIHRTSGDLTISARDDPFDMQAEDPANAKALESSLWEVVTLQGHYFPNVASMAKVFTEKMSKPRFEVEDFLDYTYGNLFETVHVPVMKKAPPLSYKVPETLFPVGEAAHESFASLFDLAPPPAGDEESEPQVDGGEQA